MNTLDGGRYVRAGQQNVQRGLDAWPARTHYSPVWTFRRPRDPAWSRSEGGCERMLVYGCWNNKGRTGKTSVNFQAICEYSRRDPARRVLVADVCPQANLSELLLGGLLNQGSDQLLALQGEPVRRTIGGYFQTRLPQPYQEPAIDPFQFITTPSQVNGQIPENIDLLAGD